MFKRAVLIGFLIGLVLLPSLAKAQRRAGITDTQILSQAQLVSSSGRIELYQFGFVADPLLAELADRTLLKMEEVLGRKLDEATLGSKLRIIVSSATTVSHVWRGYEHPSDPKGILFLNPRVATLAMSGKNATYAHELAHLLTWRFHSHTLREGLADYLALQVHPGAGVGPNNDVDAAQPEVPSYIAEVLGTTRSAPAELTSDAFFRRSYYFASYKFVSALIKRNGMNTFLKLYDAKDPELEFAKLYGASRNELVDLLLK